MFHGRFHSGVIKGFSSVDRADNHNGTFEHVNHPLESLNICHLDLYNAFTS